MRTLITTLAIVTALLAWSATAQAGATQMWRCELDDDATEADVTSMAQQWLAAAKKMEGGAQFTASVFFPVAVNATGEVDFIFVVSAPSFQEWGTFWDSYAGSPAEKLDAGHEEKITCPNSVLWESLAVTAK